MSIKHESFHNYFHCWLAEQDQHLQALISASKNYDKTNHNHKEEEANLLRLIHRVMEHYRHYYRSKSKWAKLDVLVMLSPTWRSSLEDAFLWIGGWRPSMAFHLLHSESGLQLEAQLVQLARGLGKGDLADLSPNQMRMVDELQRRIIKEEREVTEEMAEHQETVADAPMVELSHLVGELMRSGGERDEEQKRVNSTLAAKEEGLVRILQKADDLRLKTLEGVVNVLTPIQAVHFLIAAAELHLRVHEWGVKRDANQHN